MRFRNANIPSPNELLLGLGIDPSKATEHKITEAIERLSRPPQEITDDVQCFAHQLSSEESPTFVPIDTAAWAEPNECFAAVEKKIEQEGGQTVCGWAIVEWPNIKLEAEFHAVWRSEEGELVDVSVRPRDHEVTLFVPAHGIEYTGKMVPSRFYKLWNSEVVQEWIDLHTEKTELENRYFSDGRFDVTACAKSGDLERLNSLEAYSSRILMPLMLKHHFSVNCGNE